MKHIIPVKFGKGVRKVAVQVQPKGPILSASAGPTHVSTTYANGQRVRQPYSEMRAT